MYGDDAGRLCCTNRPEGELPLSQTDSAYCLCDRYANSGVAVEGGDADLDLGNLPFEVPRHERLAKQFHTMHFRLNAASAVVSAPASPHRAAQIPLRIDRIVTGNCSCARPLPGSCCLQQREGASRAWHSCVAGSPHGHLGRQSPRGIYGCRTPRPLPGRRLQSNLPRGGGDTADVLIGRDLIQQLG